MNNPVKVTAAILAKDVHKNCCQLTIDGGAVYV
jgi:hypothetical protein